MISTLGEEDLPRAGMTLMRMIMRRQGFMVACLAVLIALSVVTLGECSYLHQGNHSQGVNTMRTGQKQNILESRIMGWCPMVI